MSAEALESCMSGGFTAYASISTKVGKGLAPGSADKGVAWAATHKLHGVNVSVTIEGGASGGVGRAEDGSDAARPSPTLSYARRNGFLKPSENFYGFMDVLPRAGDWGGLFQDLVAADPHARRVTVFGELYGGHYPHPDVPPASPRPSIVQKGVRYHPQVRFVAFDIRVNDTRYLDLQEAVALFRKFAVPHVQVVFSGPYEDVLAWAQEHRAAVVDPAWYQCPDLPVLDGNKGEGWVVRPLQELALTWGDRAMYKVKNPDFNEIVGTGSGSGSGSGTETGRSSGFVSTESVLVTAARVANVLSKELPDTLTFANFKKLTEAVVRDAQTEGTSLGIVEDPATTAKSAGPLVRAYLKSLVE